MKKSALVSKSVSGALNVYLPIELQSRVRGRKYVVDLQDMTDGTRCLILRESPEGKNTFNPTGRESPTPLRAQFQKLPEILDLLEPFSVVTCDWSYGEGDADLHLMVPPPGMVPAPAHRAPRADLGKKRGSAAPAKIVYTPELAAVKLRGVLRELNELLASGALADFEFRALGSDGKTGALNGFQRLIARRTEEFS